MSLQILYEDNHLIAVNKPAGWLVQGDITGDQPLSDWVKSYIKKKYNKPGDVYLGVIHRLDRPVSGVVFFARTSKSLTRMNQLFKDRKVKKVYWAITKNSPEPLQGHLEHYIAKDREKNTAKAYDYLSNRAINAKAKHSELDYEMIAKAGSNHLLQIYPKTGRPHQIRVQLGKIDCPIRGDMKYGFRRPNGNGSIHLHCRTISFIHPIKKELVEVSANLPNDEYWNLFRDVTPIG